MYVVAVYRDCVDIAGRSYARACQARRVGGITSYFELNTIRYDTIEEINVDSKAEYTA